MESRGKCIYCNKSVKPYQGFYMDAPTMDKRTGKIGFAAGHYTCIDKRRAERKTVRSDPED